MISPYPYHRQDFPNECGAACLQMILEKNDNSTTTGTIKLADHKSQAVLFHQITDLPGPGPWNASPKKMQVWLKAIVAPYQLEWKPFEDASSATEADTKEVLSFIKASAADGVLVPCHDYDHWALVTGQFLGKSYSSALNQLHLVVNDPLGASGSAYAHSLKLCGSGNCGLSPEIWGPVRISDFLKQTLRGSLCIRNGSAAGTLADPEITTALDPTPPSAASAIVAAAQKHYTFFKANVSLPDLPLEGQMKPPPGHNNIVYRSGPAGSNYPDRVQVRLKGELTNANKTEFSVWVEMCASSFRLSRVRYLDDEPDWWKNGNGWSGA